MSKEFFRVSGKKVSLPAPSSEWSFESRPGGWVIGSRKTAEGTTERKRFFLNEVKGKLSFSLDGFLFFGSVQAESRTGSGAAGSDQDLVAQFPGKVRKILVRAEDVVEEGRPLLLLEAMKMEFSVKAPYSGKITKILVTEGQQLAPGDRFLEMKK